MKICRSLSWVYNCLATHRLIWEEAAEQPELQADAKPDLPFTFAMCDEAADTTEKKGGKVIYDELCRINTVEDVEISNWVRDFTDQLVQKLNPKAFDAAKSSAQRWEVLKKLIPQQSDLDNLIRLIQEATDFKIHYGRGILVVALETPKGPQQYHVIINENLASKFIGETEWFKQWIKDHQLDREKMNEEEVRRAEEQFLEETNGRLATMNANLFDEIINGAPTMDADSINFFNDSVIPWVSVDEEDANGEGAEPHALDDIKPIDF